MHKLLAFVFSILLLSPVAAQESVARVGFLSWQDTGAYYDMTLKGFIDGLREEGFVPGKNLELLRRSASNDAERFKPIARELAASKVDVFFAPATPMATPAWYADKNTPIVVATILDPVALGITVPQAVLARPDEVIP